MKYSLILLLFFAMITSAFVLTVDVSDNQDVEDVKAVILKGYVHGAFNELNPEEMTKTFHEDFAIFSTDGEALNRFEIADWVERTEKRKSSSEFDPVNNVWEHNFASVDVTGNSASVKIELHRKGVHVYTDYLSLLKFNDGLKIVAKVYHQHTN